MSARGIGAIIGFVIGLVLCVGIFRICNNNNKLKSEYDERQEVIRGRAYKYGFYAAIFYLVFLTIWPLTEISLNVSDAVLGFCGIILSVCVMAIYSIWNDAYWGINNNRTRYLIIFVVATVINLLVGIRSVVSGDIIEDGIVQAPCINLLCGLMFLVVTATLLIKKFADKAEEDA